MTILKKLIQRKLPKDFDPAAYLAIHSDVAAAGMDPALHYLRFGIKEGREYRIRPAIHDRVLRRDFRLTNDNYQHVIDWLRSVPDYYQALKKCAAEENVDPKWYLLEYPEVADLALTPQQHYDLYGRLEGRHPRFDQEWYLAQYPDVANAGVDPLQHYLQHGRSEFRNPAFHSLWYCLEYRDVAHAELEPKQHYLAVGRFEGRHPALNKEWYSLAHGDVVDAGFDIYFHYLMNGRGEGRSPGFADQWYVAEYPDALAVTLSPVEHFFKYGAAAGYRPCPDRKSIIGRVRLVDFPVQHDSWYSIQEDFNGKITDIKAMAFYLPQFHETAENNRWWGEGFTEWTNTRKSKPRFAGHYQPRVPHADIGYYDLSDVNALRSQALMAKKHGIHGFCFYHYWFSGEKLLNKPVELLLENKDIDTKFCLCWANENWTRTWDGLESEVLIAQEYSSSDPERFIRDVEPFLTDARYIKIDGRPVLIVYRPSIIPNVGDVFAAWKKYWISKYDIDLEIWCVRTDGNDHQYANLDAEFDAVVEFPPHVVPASRHPTKYKMSQEFGGIACDGNFYDYRMLVDDVTSGNDYSPMPAKRFYRGVTLGWDNSARRETGQSIWYGFSAAYYDKWLRHTINYTRRSFPSNSRFLFINAWNEWAEGTYLEPDEGTGYTNLNTTSRALFGMPFLDGPSTLVLKKDKQPGASAPRIAVHFHIFYTDLLEECLGYLRATCLKFDLFITTDSEAKKKAIEKRLSENYAGAFSVLVTHNRGRDIGPMLFGIRRTLLEYDIIGHFHTKRSKTVEWGDHWRRYLFDNLLPPDDQATALIDMLSSDAKIGLISAPPYPLIDRHVGWGDVQDRVSEMLIQCGCEQRLPSAPSFPVGNMFWARIDAIAPFLQKDWKPEDFEPENDQVSETTAHCVERIWPFVVAKNGFVYKEVLSLNKGLSSTASLGKRRLCIFVHYNSSDTVDDADLHLLKSLQSISSSVVTISNSRLDASSADLLRQYSDRLIERANAGYDFSAWKQGIEEIGWATLTDFDEVVLVNNSCWGPIYPFTSVFETMAESKADFWGLTSFPRLEKSKRPEARYSPSGTIDRHLQSYFLVFRKPVLASPQFYRFWQMVETKHDMVDVVFSYEVGLSAALEKAGYKFDVYIPESEILQLESDDPRFNHPYNRPDQLVILKSPLIKKRSGDYDPASFEKARALVKGLGHFPVHLLKR